MIFGSGDILYEDNHIIAVNKPGGLLTQGDSSGASSLLDLVKSYIKKRDGKPGNVFLGMVHRLDRPVSGVVVFAKTSKAAGRLSEEIRNRRMNKLYIGLTPDNKKSRVDGKWCRYRHHLLRRGDKTMVVSGRASRAQEAVLQMTTFSGGVHACHLVRLITGRKHQIRVQLSHLGLPLHGDGKYGSKQSFADGAIGLHSLCVEVAHPVRQERLLVRAPLPEPFISLLSSRQLAELEKEVRSLFAGNLS